MRIALHKLFAKGKKWSFQKADFEESTIELQNPARGLFKIFPFMVEEEPYFEKLSWCDEDKNSLALVIINIGEYRDERMPDEALFNMRKILDFFAEKKYDVILRITYDHLGNALEREPFFFSQVKEHLEQIIPIIHDYRDTIFVYQGMLIGNWGEMHTSKFVSAPKLKELWQILNSNIGDEVFFAVRKPSFWRLLHPQSCDSPRLLCDKMGLFDDAIFGSMTHLGTFGSTPREASGWDALWSRESELQFENELCLKVPNGGEALAGEYFINESSMPHILNTLSRMHVTYLNEAYDRVILDTWKRWNCSLGGIWQNKSMYEYIGAHLGYRFVVRDVSFSLSEEEHNKMHLYINVENVGFANFYQEAEVFLHWIDAENRMYHKSIETDMRNWDSGTISCIETDINVGKYFLYLSAVRKKDNRIIYFANPSDKSGRVFLGYICEI